MSRKHQNNHYHYAEKFSDRKRKISVFDIIKAPRKAFVLALIVLMTFGLISTTFAAFVSSDSFDENVTSGGGSLVLGVRNTLAQREGKDLADTGANVDLAGTGTYTQSGYIYYVNTTNWSSVYWHPWGPGWNGGYLQMSRIGSTGIYVCTGAKGYNNMNGWGFQSGNGSGSWIGNFEGNYGNVAADGNKNVITDLSKLNGSAKVIVSIDSTGSGTYSTDTKSSDCIATISSYTLSSGATSTSSVSASTTGSTNYATISPAYASNVNYTASASNGYTFMGFSTNHSSSLPSNAASTYSQQSLGYNGNNNPATVYAYFKKQATNVNIGAVPYYQNYNNTTKTYGTAVSGNIGGSVSPASTATTSGSSVTLTAAAAEGYTFDGWYSNTGFTNKVSSDVSYTFNAPSSNTTYYALFKQNKPYYLVGDFTSTAWEAKDDYIFNDNGECTVEHSNNGTLNFKIYSDGTYYTNKTQGNTTTVTLDATYDMNIEGGTGNEMQLNNLPAGTYLFKLTVSGNSRTITVSETLSSHTITKATASNGSFTVTSGGSAVTSAMKDETITVTPTAATGYEVDAVTYTYGSTTNNATLSGGVYTFSMPNANVTVSVTFKKKTYTVTYTGYGSQLNSRSDESVAYRESPRKIPSENAYGYEFKYWEYNGIHYSSAEVAAHEITSNRTYTAKYDILPPVVTANDSIYTVGDAPTKLNYTISYNATPPGGAVHTKRFSVTEYPDDAVASDVNIDEEGYFSADVPGEYTVKVVGTSSNTKTVNGEASAEDTCKVTVYPAVPEFRISLTGYTGGDGAEDEGTESNPCIVLLGDTYHFSAAVVEPIDGYTYEWSADGTTWNNLSDGTDEYSVANISASGSEITFDTLTASDTVESKNFTLYLRTTKNGVSKEAEAKTLYYRINPLISRFDLLPNQKIYSISSAASAALLAEYNFKNADSYTTSVRFSADNNTFTESESKNGSFLSDFSTTLTNCLQHAGVKYFKLAVSKGGGDLSSESLHTTVGTKDTAASRAVYFINNITDLDLNNKRLVAYWADESADSGYSYQTAQDVYKGVDGKTENKRFRVTLPSDVTKVAFAVVNPDFYGMPDYDNDTDTFAFQNPDNGNIFFYACTQNIIEYSETNNTFTANSATDDTVRLMTGSASSFVTD